MVILGSGFTLQSSPISISALKHTPSPSTPAHHQPSSLPPPNALQTPSPNRTLLTPKTNQSHSPGGQAPSPAGQHQSNSQRSPASAQSTPSKETERRSFQGDHHRHRFMGYPNRVSSNDRRSPHSRSNDPNRPSPSAQSQASPSNYRHQLRTTTTTTTTNNQLSQAQPNRRQSIQGPRRPSTHQKRRPSAHDGRYPSRSGIPLPTQHLGAPSNAHYSPHYGGSPAHRAPTGKRKPPPSDKPNPVDRTPNHPRNHTPESPSPASQRALPIELAPSPSPSNSPCSIVKLGKSRSPSPSPRAGALVKKIGSVLSAPFKSARSRAGSDVSDSGFGPHASPNPSAGVPSEDRIPQERLPSMPTAGDSPHPSSFTCEPVQLSSLTPAEQIAHETRIRQSVIIVPEAHDRVLRVVNGCPTTSTRASLPRKPDLKSVLEPPSNSDQSSSTPAQQPSRYSNQASFLSCHRCGDLEHRLDVEAERSRALELALGKQATKFEQFKIWSQGQITTFEHAIKSQELLLQGLEQRLYDANGRPDIKSDYLIALQKDVVDLHSRLSTLETKQARCDEKNNGTETSIEVSTDRSSSIGASNSMISRPSSTQPTSLGRITPISRNPHLYDLPAPASVIESSVIYPRPRPEGVISRSPPNTDLNQSRLAGTSTPKRPTTIWKASSPADLASKLAPPPATSPKSPSSNLSRSAPGTPCSRSPRPRYTSALGGKPPSSPLSQNISSPIPNRVESPTAPNAFRAARAMAAKTSDISCMPPIKKAASMKTISALEALDKSKLRQIHTPSNFHSKRMSVLSDRSMNVDSSQSLSAPSTATTKPLAIRNGTKKPVGDLIKMFDSQK